MVQIEKREEGGAGEGAAPPLQCKQSLDSSFVLAMQVFLGIILVYFLSQLAKSMFFSGITVVCFLRAALAVAQGWT